MENIDNVERAAMQQSKMPDGLDIFDQFRYHGLSYIYHNYKNGVMNKDTASSYKQSLLREIKTLKADYAFAIRCYDTAAERYKGTERAVGAFLKDKTIDNALEIVNALHGLKMTNEGGDRNEH